MTLAEPIAVTLEITAALDKLGITYLVGGSFASSVRGIPRSTQDVDLLIELSLASVDALVAELRPRFYVQCRGHRCAEARLVPEGGASVGASVGRSDRRAEGARGLEYLRQAAAALGVAELLEQALAEVVRS